MFSLNDKVAIVFGGGSIGGEINNGLAASLVYARAGAKVVVIDSNQAAVDGAIERFASETREDGSALEIIGIVGDVTSETSVAASVEKTISAWGQIDILHNNVGIARMGGPIEMSLEEWNLVLNVNLTSAFLTTKFVLPHMLGRKKGAIVNVASIGGMRYIGYNYPSYTATKAAVIGFTQNIALEYADQGIRANSIAPGYIETPMIYKQISGAYDSIEEMLAARNALSPTGKMGESFDVANAALFLASDEAKYVNGITLPVDGGLIQRATQPADKH